MQEFLSSLRQAFQSRFTAAQVLGAAALLVVAAVVAWIFVDRAAKQRGARRALDALAERQHLTPGQVGLLAQLAAGGDPAAIGARIDLFEQAVAALISDETLPPSVEPGDLFSQLRELRLALGFDELPPHFPLLSSRLLRAGALLEVGAGRLRVVEVNEACFVAEGAAALPVGMLARLRLSREGEARYELACNVLAVGTAGEARRVTFAHDAAPVRAQLRDYLRVEVDGRLDLRPLSSPLFQARLGGRLIDFSAGGALARMARRLPIGLSVMATFEIGDAHLAELESVVLACTPSRAGSFRVRLEFVAVEPALRDHLVALVAQLDAAARAES